MGVAGALVVGFGLVATETVRLGRTDRPTFAGTVEAVAHQPAVTLALPSVAGRPCRSPLTDSDPLRLWVGGDSLAGSLGPALGALAGATGVVQPYFDSRVSSGLANPGFFDWPKHAAKEMARLDPEIVVFIIGANDFLVPVARPGTTDAVGPAPEAPWKADYRARVETMLSVLAGPNRTIIWVGPPPFKNERDNTGVQQVSDLSRDVVAERADAVFVDGYSLFLDANGKYAEKLVDRQGNLVTMRTGDGVHFTNDGGRHLARAVFTLVDEQCDVTAQAVPGATKRTIQTEGSTLVDPRSSRQGEPLVTTPPATAPPTTDTAPTETVPTTSSPPAETAPPTSTTIPEPTTTTAGGGSPGKGSGPPGASG